MTYIGCECIAKKFWIFQLVIFIETKLLIISKHCLYRNHIQFPTIIIWSISDIGPCSVLSDYPTSTDISMFLNPFLYFIHRSLWKARVNLNGFLFRKSISDRWYKHSKHSRIFRTVETFLRLAKWFLVRYQANLSLEPWPNRHGTRLTKPFVVGSTGKKSPSIIAPHSIPLLGSFIS